MIRVIHSAAIAALFFSCLVVADEVSDSPNGSILYSSIGPRGWDVYVLDAGATEPRQLTDHPALDYNAVLSPDGETVAFVSERDGIPNLYTIRRNGSDLKQVTDSFSLDDHPAWSPDSSQIAFSSTREPSDRLGQAWNAVYVMSADGKDVHRVSPPGVTDYSPAWSPDGEWLACASGLGDAGGTALYIMKPDGSGRKRVVSDGGWPTFSSDSQWLYFHRYHKDAERWGVWGVKLDGTGEKRISADGSDVTTPRNDSGGSAGCHFASRWTPPRREDGCGNRGPHESFSAASQSLEPIDFSRTYCLPLQYAGFFSAQRRNVEDATWLQVSDAAVRWRFPSCVSEWKTRGVDRWQFWSGRRDGL